MTTDPLTTEPTTPAPAPPSSERGLLIAMLVIVLVGTGAMLLML